MIFKMVAM